MPRSLADKDSYSSNEEIRNKISKCKNVVTISVYKSIIVHRAQNAIIKQPFFK